METMIWVVIVIIIIFLILTAGYAVNAERNKGILDGLISTLQMNEPDKAIYLKNQYLLNKEKVHQFSTEELYEWINYELKKYEA